MPAWQRGRGAKWSSGRREEGGGAIAGKMDYWVTQQVDNRLNTRRLIVDAAAFGGTESQLWQASAKGSRALYDITKG